MQKLNTVFLTIGCTLAIVFLNVGFLFLMLGLLPTIVAYFVDDSKQKDLYKTVRATNLAGILPSLSEMFGKSNPSATLQVAMSDPSTWMIVYGAAACGYVLIWTSKWVAYFSVVAASETRIMMLESTQKELVKEWGEEITEFTISERPKES